MVPRSGWGAQDIPQQVTAGARIVIEAIETYDTIKVCARSGISSAYFSRRIKASKGPELAFRDPNSNKNTSAVSRHQLLGEVGGLVSVEVRPVGRLDIESADDFRQMFKWLLEAGVVQFFLDLGEVSYVDSTGVGALIQLYRNTKSRGGRAWFFNPTLPVREIFSMTHLDRVMELYATRQEAFAEAEKARR